MSLVVSGYILLSPNLSLYFLFTLAYIIDGLPLQEHGDPATDDGLQQRVVHYPFAVNEKVLIKVGHYCSYTGF